MNQISVFFIKKFSSTRFLFIATTPFLALLMNLKGLLVGLMFVIFLDLLTGIVKYLHANNIEFKFFELKSYRSVKSDLLRKSLKKTYEYGIMIVVGILLEELLFHETIMQIQDKQISISQISVIMPMAVEIWSIFENIEEVTNNNILKKVFSFLPDKFQALLKGKVEETKEDDKE